MSYLYLVLELLYQLLKILFKINKKDFIKEYHEWQEKKELFKRKFY